MQSPLRLFCLLIIISIISACGGGGGSNSKSVTTIASSEASLSSLSSNQTSLSTSSSSSISSSRSSSSAVAQVNLSGTVTFDYIPHNINRIGLNYSAVEKRPVRGAMVEAVGESGSVIATSSLSNEGRYNFTLPLNTMVKVRIKAQLAQAGQSPKYDFRVTNNTNNNALYAVETTLATTGTADSVRNLHAASGWDGTQYAEPRSAAPFAILDYVYIALNKLISAGNKRDLSALELRWSPLNNSAEGDEAKGEIGTSFFDGTAIYLLGDADNDTDEYDGHVLIHEWGHFLEDNLFRSDSLGGAHQDGQSLDLRVAMSEGWANAFSGMMLDDPNYMDASGNAQASGFSINIAKKNRLAKGFYSEGSVGSVFMNFYSSAKNKAANDWSSILSTMNQPGYYEGSALTSIFLFYDQLKLLNAAQAQTFYELMQEQNINGADAFGAGESNNGSLNNLLPLYKSIVIGGSPVSVCSSPEFGKYNKLGNSAFIKLVVPKLANYQFTATKVSGATGLGRPEIYVLKSDLYFAHFNDVVSEGLTGNANLSPGIYVVEVFDQSNRDEKNSEKNTFCYDIKIQ